MPYALAKLGLSQKIFCTLSVSRWVRCSYMTQSYLFTHGDTEFTRFNLDEVDNAFPKLITLKYNEEFIVEEHELAISVCDAARMVDGVVWVTSKGAHNISHVADDNHKGEEGVESFKDRVTNLVLGSLLNGLRFESLRRLTLVVTD
eukprot:g7461.t1